MLQFCTQSRASVPGCTAAGVEVTVETEKCKSPGGYQITADFTVAECSTAGCGIHRHIYCIWSAEELLQQRKESVIARVCEKGNAAGCSNNGGVSFVSTAHKILSNILL
jgi:hypothetical protein